MRNQLMSLALSVLALTVAAPAAHAQSASAQRPSVALLDFDFGSIQPWWSGNVDLGKQVTDLLVDELVNDGTFRVIERKRLDALMSEQSFSNSERADPSAAALVKLGKGLGVKYLIVGSVTRFGLENSRRSVTPSIGLSILRIGSVSRTEGKGTVAITARIIDVETGEILVSAKGEGMSKRKGFQVEGRQDGVAPPAGLSLTSSDFQVTVMGEATEAAIKSTAAKLVAARARLE
jgi:curli biogenesis system outer membrane secretion channel CsgG